MLLMRDFRLRTLVLSVCISLGSWIAASVPTQSVQYPGRAPAPVSTSRGLACGSVSVLATATPLKFIRNRAWNTTSLVNNSTTSSASSTSSDLPSSATGSSIDAFGPRGPPNNAHVIKLAEIVLPTVGVPLVVTAAYARFLVKTLKKEHGMRIIDLRRRIKKLREWQKMLEGELQTYRDWEIWMLRKMLTEEAEHPGSLFSDQQIRRIREMEADYGESIWNGNNVWLLFTF